VVADERLGAPLDETLMQVAFRMRSTDLEQVALVAALGRETGGNTAEVLDRVAETVRGRFDLRRLVRTLTTQGRMSRWVLSLLPVGLLLLMTLINPAYVAPLYFNPVGRILLVVAGVMVVAGSLVIKRIVDIKV
jgi:tight adherence protein B